MPPQNPKELEISRSKAWPWYQKEVGDKITQVARDLLENYSGIAPEKVEEHVYKARNTAWEIFPWPCIGEFWFLAFGLSTHPSYQLLLSRLHSDATTTFLDLGTCLGQDLRKMIYDGAPLFSQLYGSDIFVEFEDAGHALFNDKDKFTDRFIAADVFDEDEGAALVKTEGTWSVISIFMFLHVWDYNDQVRVCKRILKLLSSKPDSWIIGAQTGSVKPRDFPLKPPFVKEGEKRSVYRHSVETFREMWVEVAVAEKVKLDIWVEYEETADARGKGGGKTIFEGEDNRRFFFLLKRV